MKDKRLVRWIAISYVPIAILVLLFAVGWRLLPARARGHLHFLTPRLTGKVVFCDESTVRTYKFSAQGGDYGTYEWTVGPDDHPIKIELFNTNSWYVTNMELRVELNGNDWIVSGTVNTDGEEPMLVSNTIPVGDPIIINRCGL